MKMKIRLGVPSLFIRPIVIFIICRLEMHEDQSYVTTII